MLPLLPLTTGAPNNSVADDASGKLRRREPAIGPNEFARRARLAVDESRNGAPRVTELRELLSFYRLLDIRDQVLDDDVSEAHDRLIEELTRVELSSVLTEVASLKTEPISFDLLVLVRAVESTVTELLGRPLTDGQRAQLLQARTTLEALTSAVVADAATQAEEDTSPGVIEVDTLVEDDTDAPLPAESLSQLADDLADDPVDVPVGQATQLEGGDVDVTRGRQTLQQARDDLVALLRSVGDDDAAPLPNGTNAKVRDILRRVAPFESASELARRMRGILEGLAERDETDDAPFVALDQSQQPQQPQQQPQPSGGRPTSPTIVGRASDIVRGRERQSFLLFDPPSTFAWLTFEGIRRDPELSRILDAYTGPKGTDPSGRGFVAEILEATGPSQRRRYKPRWQTEPWVPLTAATDGWYAASQLVGTARELAVAFDRAEEDEDGDGDGDTDDDATTAEPGSQVGSAGDGGSTQMEKAAADGDGGDGGGGGGGSGVRRGALVFDASSGRPKLSLRQAFNTLQTVERWTIDAVFEYTVNRIFVLDARVPPISGQPGAPTASELEQLGRDLFSIDRTALIGAFRRERIQLERDRALVGDDGEGDEDADFEADEESALEQWTADREREFREAAVDLWEATRREQAADRAVLSAQLAAIRLIESATDDGSDPPTVLARALSDGVSAEAIAYLEPWAADPTDAAWVRPFRRPGLKLPKIRDFLSPNRSAIAKGYLQLLRDVHSASTKRERQTGIFGSIYSSRWPARPTPTTTPPDHVRVAPPTSTRLSQPANLI